MRSLSRPKQAAEAQILNIKVWDAQNAAQPASRGGSNCGLRGHRLRGGGRRDAAAPRGAKRRGARRGGAAAAREPPPPTFVARVVVVVVASKRCRDASRRRRVVASRSFGAGRGPAAGRDVDVPRVPEAYENRRIERMARARGLCGTDRGPAAGCHVDVPRVTERASPVEPEPTQSRSAAGAQGGAGGRVARGEPRAAAPRVERRQGFFEAPRVERRQGFFEESARDAAAAAARAPGPRKVPGFSEGGRLPRRDRAAHQRPRAPRRRAQEGHVPREGARRGAVRRLRDARHGRDGARGVGGRRRGAGLEGRVVAARTAREPL